MRGKAMRIFDGVAGRRGTRGAATAGDAAAHHLAAQRCVSALAVLVAIATLAPVARAEAPGQLPRFTHTAADEWLNAAPLASADLRGHPVLVEVWTFECSNCLASLPWMQRIAGEYQRRGLVVVGVHAPELSEERDRAHVAAAVRRLSIGYPVMLDADFSYWRALGNRYWPAFYLYDAAGRLLATRIGELHTGEASADDFERLIASQLAALDAGRR
jgi:thiol-disulfide isomerase/thioredoxin